MQRAQRGQQSQSFGRSRGGFSSKIHATTDALGCPTRFHITGGHESDCKHAVEVLSGQNAAVVLADKGYDTNEIVNTIEDMGSVAVIPPRSRRLKQRDYDRHLYKERNAIERMFNKMKQFRRVATRYDKLASSYMSFLHIAGIWIWLN